jgi:hypothetical protein
MKTGPWTITVAEIPPSQNTMLRWHWQKLHQERRRWVSFLGYQGAKRIPAATETTKRRVLIEIHKGPRGKFDDPDNLPSRGKFILDALRELGVLWDDTNEHVAVEFIDHGPTPTKRTTVTVADMPGGAA